MSAPIVVVGAGAIGASTAYHLAAAGHAVTVVEKEPGPAQHQSGRNSGVIHSGYNLKPGSAKARFCIEGSRRLLEYCQRRGVRVEQGGILVVATHEGEVPVLRELRSRADANGVAVAMLDGDGLRRVEPAATGVAALHAPGGASFDAPAYVAALVDDAKAAGATFRYGVRVQAIEADGVRTDVGRIAASVVVNAAGLYSDVLAGALAPDLRIIPFRGYYAQLRPAKASLVRSHIYAAPDLAFPFLGVHLSRRIDGSVLVGPGAMLAFGREAYSLASLRGGGLGRTLSWPGFYRLLATPAMRGLMRSEVAKSLSRNAICAEAQRLVPALRRGDLLPSFAGNRAQQVDREGKLVEDIVVRETPTGVHVLNAVSPGLTCSLPFGEHLATLAAAKR